MYKFALLVLFIASNFYGSLANPPPPNDIFSDAMFQKNLIECKQYCVQQDSKHDAQQTCKVFTDKKLVLTDCEVQCMKFPKEETDKASTCPCVSGRCVGDTKPPQNSAIKYIPEIFTLMFVIYTAYYVV